MYALATREKPNLEGPEWESIFADAIKAKWKPSNVGLDDVQLGASAWGIKSLKSRNPFEVPKVRLISGRNNPEYSFGEIAKTPNGVGEQVLKIYNARVAAIRELFAHVRTVVFIKSYDLTKITVYEKNTVIFSPENYYWEINKRNNYEGYDKETKEHKFTWQRHGSQFTIFDKVPEQKLCFSVKMPEISSFDEFLEKIGFDESWVIIHGR